MKHQRKKHFLPNAITYENTITFIKFQKITLMKKSCNRKKSMKIQAIKNN